MRLVSLFVLVSALALSACGPPGPSVPQLRVINSGKEPIADLMVMFPDSAVAFGDIPVGATTAYIAVPRGVYSYAAFRFRIGGYPVTQRVVDFDGASPMGRARFTYRLELDSEWTPRGVIQLIEVKNDG